MRLGAFRDYAPRRPDASHIHTYTDPRSSGAPIHTELHIRTPCILKTPARLKRSDATSQEVPEDREEEPRGSKIEEERELQAVREDTGRGAAAEEAVLPEQKEDQSGSLGRHRADGLRTTGVR